MDRKILSHDILNLLERLRIMHDIVKDQRYDAVSKDELQMDLKESLESLEKTFLQFIQ